MITYTLANTLVLQSHPVLTDGQIYIYALQNEPQNNIKIGKTTNIHQRVVSLSGSNGGGSKISKIYISPFPTWMQSIEGTCHNHFDYYRIKGTEWFDGSKITFDEVTRYIESLFFSKGFMHCNEVRHQFILKYVDITSVYKKELFTRENDNTFDDNTNYLSLKSNEFSY